MTADPQRLTRDLTQKLRDQVNARLNDPTKPRYPDDWKLRDLADTALALMDEVERLAAVLDVGTLAALRTAEGRCQALERLLAHVPLHADECRTCDEIGEHRYAR